MSARVTALPAGIWMLGEIFHPTPSSLAAAAPVPSEAAPPAPLPPVRFSALSERLRPAVSNDIPALRPRSSTGNPSTRQRNAAPELILIANSSKVPTLSCPATDLTTAGVPRCRNDDSNSATLSRLGARQRQQGSHAAPPHSCRRPNCLHACVRTCSAHRQPARMDEGA